MGEDPGAVSARALDESGVPQRTTVGDAPAAAAQPTPETPEELREEIERTRQDLGDTVAALAEKTDVKARAKDKVAEVKSNVTEKKTELMGRARESSPDGANSAAVQVRTKAQQNPVPTAALAAFVGGFLFGRITKRDS
jgi:chromosome segregation ATPase